MNILHIAITTDNLIRIFSFGFLGFAIIAFATAKYFIFEATEKFRIHQFILLGKR